MKEFLLLASLIFSFSLRADESNLKGSEDDATKITQYRERCEVINTLLVKDTFKLNCYSNYNHYGPTSKQLRATGALKIANYNLLHPGTSKALFKDYGLVAKIMNQYDVVSGLELLATVGHDEANNKAVLDLIRTSPAMVEKLRAAKAKLKDAAKIQEMDNKINKLITDTRAAYDLYRAPGYMRALLELKKLDPSWSLILSPRGDSAIEGSVEELAGFFYRANSVTPATNPHCKEYAGEDAGPPVACIITLTKDFMGKDLLQYFSRRPFMATFKANNTTFTLVTSHVVYTYSGDEAAEKNLLQDVFGTDDIKKLGPGINSANFARYAEVKTTLEFMNRFKKKYNDAKIIYQADTNLVSNNPYWTEVLKSFPGAELLIKDPTTLSPTRYMSGGKETNGEANDYDHFILDKSEFKGCNSGEVYNYYKENIYKDIEARYVIRKETVGLTKKYFRPEVDNERLLGLLTQRPVVNGEDVPVLDGDIPPTDDPAPIKLDYELTPAGQSKMDRFVAVFGKNLKAMNTVKNSEVVADDFQVTERLEGMNRRVFLRQLTNPFYYRFMQEVLSDHFPVVLTCKF
ncbi:MAG: hypothetical protein H7177_15935 [Rhizobacter sp.]|nr:hypothetical protein [Bacteriovorax sp.]